MNKPDFKWDGVNNDLVHLDEKGNRTVNREEFLKGETFIQDQYEHIYPVKEGDVVLDLGASIGIFTWKIMDRAAKVYAIEPLIDLIPFLKGNTVGYNVTTINAFLNSGESGEVLHTDNCINNFEPKLVRSINFKEFLNENNIEKIDYIKTDCEGGEYDLISNENIGWIKNNVRNIVGEWHLSTDEEKIEFRYFRDKFLPQFKNVEVYSVIDQKNIKWDLYNEHFLEYYNQVIIHIEV